MKRYEATWHVWGNDKYEFKFTVTAYNHSEAWTKAEKLTKASDGVVNNVRECEE
jgi:hypothetical protein